jgi:hypothetical protein
MNRKTNEIVNENKNENKNENDSKNENTSFILKKNKKSGNFSILKKGSTFGSVERIRYKIHNAKLPFGCEEYKDNFILNAVIDDSNNYNHNLIITLRKIIKAFEDLKMTDSGKYKYSIDNKTFFSFLKELDLEDDLKDNLIDILKDSTKDTLKDNIKKYQIRMYLKYGAKITHAKLIGELNYEQLKGKRCDIDIELGSLWVNDSIKQYGINIFVTHITVLN